MKKSVIKKRLNGLLIPTLLMTFTLITLVVGATYAYFKVNVTNDVSTVKVSATTDSVGIVSLSAGDDLKLELTAAQMMQMTSDTNYYATISGNPTTDENNVAIATASVEGNGTMNCEYELSTSLSGKNNMYNAFSNMTGKSAGQLVLTINDTDYDLYDTIFPVTISGTLEGLNENTSKDIMASFKVVNKRSVNQNNLAGTDLTISFSVSKFDCDIVG